MDAFGKGKGKGWMANNGKCHVCDGDGHIARRCPSARGPDGKATGTDVCYGCHGKGHRKDVCPTADPNSKETKVQKAGGRTGARAEVVAAEDGAGKAKVVAAKDGAKAKAKVRDCTN